MGYLTVGDPSPGLQPFVFELETALERLGFELASDAERPEVVLNIIDDRTRPRPSRRRSRGTFVAALRLLPEPPADPLREGYPVLVRALANISLAYVPNVGVWFTTLERGSYLVPEDAGITGLARSVAARLAPLARSRLVIENEFRTDLERELWAGDAVTESIAAAGRRLDTLGVLPAPFPIENILDERDLRHVYRLYGLGGLSYGNVSAREDANRFWMSASGVNKSRLETPGRDILLVSGYDSKRASMILSVPPRIEPRRVSVDAIEHWNIYRRFPEVGAIVHVHAWVDGIRATDVNYPCGTHELAESVTALISVEPDPAHAIVGLRNHGITATGPHLTEILDRIEPRLLRTVPMS
jgi:ribulose-5-phosphate 4-epimerase/fuculose-1-phosphate aldolase